MNIAIMGHTLQRLRRTLIGRVAQTNPWIFIEINHYLGTGKIGFAKCKEGAYILPRPITRLHDFYGENHGVWIARKQIT